MNRSSRIAAVLTAVTLLIVFAPRAAAAQQALEVINNHPFPIAMPWTLHGENAATVMVNVAASGGGGGTQTIALPPAAHDGPVKVSVEPVGSGVRLKSGERNLGTFAWDILLQQIDQAVPDAEVDQTRRDYEELFTSLPMRFESVRQQPLFETWAAEASKDGLKLRVELDVYPAGFIDVRSSVTNESAPQTNVFAAVLTRWQQPNIAQRTVNYNNQTALLPAGGVTPFRQGGAVPKLRHMMIQRGVDWLNCFYGDGTGAGESGAGGLSVAMLHDFAPSFTVHKEATERRPAHWTGANSAHLGQEAVVSRTGDALFSITAIARPNIRMYRSRLEPNVLPGPGEPLTFTSRLVVSDQPLADERVDELFVAWCGFNRQTSDGPATTKLSFGVPHTKFGTAYFPFSTLGENFDRYHMPGQSKATYWPLSADTVTQWKLFADDVRRDLRIARAMGFQSIRLHHLEEIERLPRNVQHEYLDFFFGELKHLGLTALLDVKLHPQRVAELVRRYGEQIDGVEYDNEVLIFGINDDEVQIWKDVYQAVKEVAPDMPVWLTAHTNMGAFERLRRLGVPFDKVGQHAYMDSPEAIPSARSYALAAADYATEIGKEPVITEWNWRFLTRMTPEARAQIYPPIFENVLKARCMPLMYQFQFQESLAMASRSLRGIRHYEQLNLSRRPRPEAFELMKLIEKYGDPSAPQNALRTQHQAVTLDPSQAGSPVVIKVSVTNTTEEPRTVTATAEGPSGVTLSIAGETQYHVGPGQTATALLRADLPPDAPPGFYHLFVRFDGGADLVSYGWVELRKPGAPRIEKEKATYPHEGVSYGAGALDYDFDRDLAVVYAAGRDDESRWDVESAWLICQTLESATGRPVKIFQLNDLPDELRRGGSLVVVGMPSDHELIQQVKAEIQPSGRSWVVRAKPTDAHGDWLIVGGQGDTLAEAEQNLNTAATDLVLRYWIHAKDAGARRIPLTDAPIDAGPDPAFLP